MPTFELTDDEFRQVISALAMQHPIVAKLSQQAVAQQAKPNGGPPPRQPAAEERRSK